MRRRGHRLGAARSALLAIGALAALGLTASPAGAVRVPNSLPGAEGPAENGAADLWIPVVAVVVVGVVALVAVRRRGTSAAARSAPRAAVAGPGVRGRPRRYGPRPTPLPELDAQASRQLVATDDAVRTSHEDVGFAAAQAGAPAVKTFAEAVDYAREELAAAFRLRAQLDGDAPDEVTRRQLLDEILSHCTQANRRLDAEAQAFDRLRGLEADVPELLEQAEAHATALPGRIAAAEHELAPLAAEYGGEPLAPVAGHPAQARALLDFARERLDLARSAVGTDHGRAALFVRLAEGALGQAATLAEATARRAADLREAEGLLGEDRPPGPYDPLAALRDGPYAEFAARSEVAAARDLISTHRGAIGCAARTNLAGAERSDVPPADAYRLARAAQRLALNDLTVHTPLSPAALGGLLLPPHGAFGATSGPTGEQAAPTTFGGPRT
ncbi:hypothetical protein [Streptomyces sp. NRRL F-5123]|uniref:hypothetical protein n=1 Tax=Streptomyces sp. NRRL F-5123 TaxID=1463856 RepID=UPI000B0E1A41|nr:hypothetical protein [Streptomyces sp. NRRL F-5123]